MVKPEPCSGSILRSVQAMRIRYLYILTTAIVLLVASLPANGQFYNGMQMAFGKNRVQYYDFYWMFYRFDNFDCYFNEEGRELAQYTAKYADKRLAELEDYFDYQLEKRLLFLIYNKHSEFRQNNIGLVSGENEYNTGGYSRIIKNKVMLYYEGDHKSYNNHVSSSIAEVLVNEMLNNADVRDRTSSSSQIYFPDWYMKGLIAHVAGTWDFESESRVKEGFADNRFKNLNHLEYDDALNAGHSFWRFIAKTYGEPIIPNIIYLTKIYKNIDKGFMYVLGQDLKELQTEWKKYYGEYFDGNIEGQPENSDIIVKAKKEQVIQMARISPDRRYIAYVTNDWGKRRIWLYDEVTGKQKRIFSKEPKLEQIIDRTYPVIGWHPNSRILTFINEEKGALKLYFYRTDEETTQSLNLLYFDKVLDFSYSPDGTRLAMSAVRKGLTDIYVHTVASGTSDQITFDAADDLNPIFLKGRPEHIIFSSNRTDDTLRNDGDPLWRTGNVFNLFQYDLRVKGRTLQRVSDEKLNDRLMVRETGTRDISFIGNDYGIYNIYKGSFDSIISYIDTITHYRYYITSEPLTNRDFSVLDYDVHNPSGLTTETGFYNNRSKLAINAAMSPVEMTDIISTSFRKERDQFLREADSVEQVRLWLIEEDRKRRDTLTKPLYEYYVQDEPIDINHYIFEREKQNYFEQLWRKDYMDIDLDTGRMTFPQVRIYMTSFYNNYVASQVDFSFLNNSYQAYNGGAPYFNPGLNLLTKIGTVDLLENYKLTGGFRFSGNFDSNEYLLSLENLKGVWDKQLVFHRQAFTSSDDTSLYKIHSYNTYLSFSKPLSEAFALKGTATYRYDRYVTLSTDLPSLNAPNIERHWGGLKAEAIFDNTRQRSINIYYGTRFKIFGEYYRELTTRKSDMFIVGVDFRHYLKIHRELIWANRFAASSSFGPTKLIYYMGGVDNWMGYLFNSLPMFDNTVPVDQTKFYGFQALATNMRGFTQNIRNGNNFALINSEIRWPFIRYFVGHPMKSNFLSSLQLVGFGDIGTAWSGLHPWSGENAYDNETIKSGPVTVVLDSNRNPIVAGVGAGLRAQIFGYFVRADYAWGIENGYMLPRIFYLSFSLDF
jgi:Tol biopolymer transport system component